MGFVDGGGGGVDAPTLGYFVFFDAVPLKDDSGCEYVVDFVKGHLLLLHLVPDAIWGLDACFKLVFESCGVKFFLDGGDELIEDFVQVFVD